TQYGSGITKSTKFKIRTTGYWLLTTDYQTTDYSHDGIAGGRQELSARTADGSRASRRELENIGRGVCVHRGSERLGEIDAAPSIGRVRYSYQRPGAIRWPGFTDTVRYRAVPAPPKSHRFHLPVL